MHFLPADIKENAHMHKVLLPLRIFGAAIYSDQRLKLVIFAMYIFCSLNFTPICAMQIYALHPDNWSSIDKISITAATAIIYLSSHFQIILLLFRRREFIDIITYVARDGKRFYLSKEKTEQQIYKDFISLTTYIFMAIYVPVLTTLFIMISTSALAFYNNNQVFEADNLYAIHPDNWSDIGKVSISAASAILYVSSNFQIVVLLLRRKEFVDIITYVARDGKRFYLSKEKTEQQIYKNFILITKYIFVVIYLPAFVTILIMVFTSASAFYNNELFEADNLLKAESVPVLFLMYPFRNSTKNFFIAYIYPYFAFFLGALFVSGWHITMAILLLYPNYVFKLINAKLEKLDEVPESKINEELVSLINLQVQTTKFTKKMESFISEYVFTDFILFSVLFCFLLYQFSENSGNASSDVVIIVLYFFVSSSIQLFYHAIGNDIYYQVDSISTSFYLSSWYSYPLTVQKAGLTIMIGAAKPIQMKAVYIDMSLSTFLNIIRASYGYLAMLRNLNRSGK